MQITNKDEDIWITEETEEPELLEIPLDYSITASPNDFNIKTLYDFILSSIIKIPAFQRNYVWDIRRASKLIESIIMGLPIPQIFLYEQDKNDFLVIDGHQRLMTVYYFIKKRFPRREKRYEIRKIFDSSGEIPDEILMDKTFFTEFNLRLPEHIAGRKNRLDRLNYDTLKDDDRKTFELRTIRSVIIRQHQPEDNSSIFEIFYRLNTGGMNLRPQEIRTSLYRSKFYDALYKLNADQRWRKLLNREQPDLHMRDIEIILRSFALLIEGHDYKPSMVKFLNNFSEKSKRLKDEFIEYLSELFYAFLGKTEDLPSDAMISAQGLFNISLYESVFRAVCLEAYNKKTCDVKDINQQKLEELKADPGFIQATEKQTTSKKNVMFRLERAEEILLQ